MAVPEKVLNQISSSKIANQTISNTQKLVWGSFSSNITDNMAVIIGSSAIQSILDHPDYKSKNYTSIISRFYHHHLNNPDEDIPDDLTLIDGTIKNIPDPIKKYGSFQNSKIIAEPKVSGIAN